MQSNIESLMPRQIPRASLMSSKRNIFSKVKDVMLTNEHNIISKDDLVEKCKLQMVQNVDIFDEKLSKLNFRLRNILIKLKDNLNCPKYLDVNFYFNENIN